MASSPRWRYTRKSIPRLEKAITLLIVLVLAGLAGLFLWDMRRPQLASPFAVDPKLLSEAARPPEVVAAGYLLPTNQVARRLASPRILTPADLAAHNTALAEVAGKYHQKHSLTANYDVAGAALNATAIDTEGPQWAFGLWCARKPAGAKLVSAGAAQAWQTDAAAAFWAGTYYVELSLAHPAASQPVASPDASPQAGPLALLLGEIGRAYVPHGRSFAAVAVLPEDGLKADSFRMTADPALGLEALKPAFVADYDAGQQMVVVATASADAARTALKNAVKGLGKQAPADPEAESQGQAPPQPDASGRVTGSLPDGRTVVLQTLDRFLVAVADPRADEAIALLEKIPRKAAEPIASAAAGATAAKAEGPLPKLQEADLAGPGEIRRFNADTLYEKIDGKAQLYLSYNFAELLFTTYTAGDTPIDVYIYDMGQADNAFGIYKAEEGENAEAVEIGAGGYASGASLFFWKGKHYVNILAGGEEASHGEAGGSEKQKEVAMRLATAIADQLKSAGQSLWAEQVLPQKDRVTGSFEFRKSDAFGLDFLKDVFSAQYKVDGKDLTLFIMRQTSPEQAKDILKQYQAFAAKYGKVLGNQDAAGAKIMIVESSGTYDVVFLKDKYFGGATAAGDQELAKTVVTRWVSELTQ